jgi:hypothetical protein
MEIDFEGDSRFYLLMQIGDPQHNTCAPLKNEFELRAVNHSERIIYLWLGDQELGPVPINRSRDFGTMPYEWRRIRDIRTCDENGERLPVPEALGGTGYVRFKMGETPSIVWWIH